MQAKHVFVFALIAASNFFLPSTVQAGILITEIMYDVPGSDSGREWVEIQNTGSATIDLANWKFFEANVNHALSLYQGAGIVPGGYAIIADNPVKFLADWPSYSGVIFDSSFSLSGGTGETLVLHDDAGVSVASVSYDPSLGAAGDGTTLQWDSAKWMAAPATPGAAYAPGSSSGSEGGAENVPLTSEETSPVIPKGIFVDAGADRTVFVGADAAFTAEAIGLSGEPLEHARYTWTFGDGGRLEGQSVLYRYLSPGTYTVVLDVSSGHYSASDRMIVKAIPADITIPVVTGETISIANGSAAELDLGGWILAADGTRFVFPEHTILASGETVVLSNERTNLAPSSPQAVSLLFPNGALAAAYESPLIVARIPKSGAASPKVATPETSAVTPTTSGTKPGSVLGAETSRDESAPPQSSAFSGILPWISGLALLVALGAGALFFFAKQKEESAESSEEDSADDYDIEEVEERKS